MSVCFYEKENAFKRLVFTVFTSVQFKLLCWWLLLHHYFFFFFFFFFVSAGEGFDNLLEPHLRPVHPPSTSLSSHADEEAGAEGEEKTSSGASNKPIVSNQPLSPAVGRLGQELSPRYLHVLHTLHFKSCRHNLSIRINIFALQESVN